VIGHRTGKSKRKKVFQWLKKCLKSILEMPVYQAENSIGFAEAL
jgi:hypothetical protein